MSSAVWPSLVQGGCDGAGAVVAAVLLRGQRKIHRTVNQRAEDREVELAKCQAEVRALRRLLGLRRGMRL